MKFLLKDNTSFLRKAVEKGKKIVFTNGCFDLIHFGHIKYFIDIKRYSIPPNFAYRCTAVSKGNAPRYIIKKSRN